MLSALSGIITMIILDYIWLAHLAKGFYLEQLQKHITITEGSLVPYIPAIPLVYIVAIVGIFFFVFPHANSSIQALAWGAFFGFLMYAFYDFTNLSTLKDYSIALTVIDILWGTFLVAAVSCVMYYIKNIF